ncbi:MAG: hypothetical protein AAF570_28015, partial [Bacteroidota bacterium]
KWSRLLPKGGLVRELANENIVVASDINNVAGLEVMLLNPLGQVQVRKYLGTDRGIELEATADGGCILALRNSRIMKLDSSLNVEWYRQYSIASGDEMTDVYPCANGDFLFTANLRDGNQNKTGGVLCRITPTGTVIWARRFRETVIENQIQHVVELPDGRIVVTGIWGAQYAFGSFPYLFLQLSSAGTLVETNLVYQPFGAGAGIQISDLAVLEDGNFVAVGDFGGGIPSPYTTDLTLVFNSDMEEIASYIWRVNNISFLNTTVRNVTATRDGGFVCTMAEHTFSAWSSYAYFAKTMPATSTCSPGFGCVGQISNYTPPNQSVSIGLVGPILTDSLLTPWDSLYTLTQTQQCRDSVPWNGCGGMNAAFSVVDS